MTERPYEDIVNFPDIKYFPPDFVKKISDRAKASFLVVFNDPKIVARTEEGYPRIDTIPPEELLRILIPEDIKNEYEKTKGAMQSSVLVETVGYRERKLGDYGCPPLQLPDYETSVVRMSKELGTQVLISGVRLPVDQRDLEYLESGVKHIQKMRNS